MHSRAKYASKAPEEPTLKRVIRAQVDAAPARDLMTEIRKQNEVAMRERLLKARKSGELPSAIRTKTASLLMRLGREAGLYVRT